MAATKIVCLANSKKLNHRCFAGKEMTAGGEIGNWIRPIDTLNKDSVTLATMTAGGAKIPRLLDVVEVPLTYRKVSHHQRENWMFDTATPWKPSGQFPHGDIGKLLDSPATLWPGDSSSKGENDRLLTEQAYDEVKQSLFLVNASDIILSKRAGFGQKQEYRAEFDYNGIHYDLGNTDLVIQSRLDAGPNEIKSASGVLCVSLTEDFKDYCYKLVAGVII